MTVSIDDLKKKKNSEKTSKKAEVSTAKTETTTASPAIEVDLNKPCCTHYTPPLHDMKDGKGFAQLYPYDKAGEYPSCTCPSLLAQVKGEPLKIECKFYGMNSACKVYQPEVWTTVISHVVEGDSVISLQAIRRTHGHVFYQVVQDGVVKATANTQDSKLEADGAITTIYADLVSKYPDATEIRTQRKPANPYYETVIS